MRTGIDHLWEHAARAGAAALALCALASPAAARPRPGGTRPRPRTQAARAKAPAPPAMVSLDVQPAPVQLSGPDARRQLLVTGRFADGSLRDLTRSVRYLPDARLFSVSPEGVVTPKADGTAPLLLKSGARTVKVPVTVAGTLVPPPVRLVTDVVPVLTKLGCNSGACHGAAAGQNGFKLSLRGFDPDLDYQQIVKEKEGARINREAPESSLLLRKATMQVPHGGGQRFKEGSPEYGVLLGWIRAGAPGPDPEFRITDVRVEPTERAVPGPGAAQQLQVTALYSDGSTRDVTPWARFSSNDDAVAAVDDATGLVKAQQGGASAVMVTYGGFVKVARILVPVQEKTPVRYAALPRANFIDDLVLRKLEQLRIEPSPPATDAEFLRRAYLDVIGTLPTPEEAEAFLAECKQERDSHHGDPEQSPRAGTETRSALAVGSRQSAVRKGRPVGGAETPSPNAEGRTPNAEAPTPNAQGPTPNARTRLIDRLLERPEFYDYRALKLSDLFRVNSQYLSQEGADSFYRWIRNRVRANVPYDALVRELLTARGSNFHVGPANYFRINDDPEKLAEATSQTFLGVRLNCAKCHNHPFERWQQKDYFGLAAFFARVARKGGPEFAEDQIYVRNDGEVKHPKTGAVLTPKPLGAEEQPVPDGDDRRTVLAAWLTSRENIQFARVAVNRLWADLFGRGIVDPVDDFRVSNPPSNDELLDELAKRFIAANYDVKAILRLMLNSRTYQLSSTMTASNERDLRHFARAYPRRLPAEVLADALDAATGKPSKYGLLPPGTRAIQIPDSRINSYLLDVFGRPKREIVCSCERDPQPNLSQMLNLVNGSDLNGRIAASDGRIAKAIAAKLSDEQIVTQLYLATLSREPRPEEKKLALEQIGKTGDRKTALEDLLWALLNSQEFIFNH